jgi:small redox-active disulfide protein 2
MKKIQILGAGCRKCGLLAETAEQAARALGLEYTLEKVTSLQAIAALGVMFTPALVVDGTIKLSGRVPSLDEAKKLLS